ncbi:MAG: ATP-binding cassette domain-containing protein [Burkholderiales bacterium]|nr:ATP-binding cassette domain-containing protein [Burkholderiales bacterium]
MTAVQLHLQHVCVQHPGAAHTAPAALQDIHLQIQQGEQIAIIGPSGAGKTSLLHTLACALRPLSGDYTWNEKNIWRLSHAERHALRRQLFLAPQSPPLPPRQRVVNAVLAGRLPHWGFWHALRNLIRPVDPLAAWQALSLFQLQHKLYARVDKLSGGERQRCGLARLLLSDANLLLVDEPLSALDPTLAVQTLESLQTEARARNATLICSLHQVELARQHFSRIIGLRDGRILFDSRDVNQQMIADLYRNARSDAADATEASADRLMPAPLSVADTQRCY